MSKRGLFIVFEGIDGCGKGTQIIELISYIKSLDKYQDVLLTHEPWKSRKIKERLEKEKNAFSSGLDIAHLFVSDRSLHSRKLIIPNVKRKIFVISDRYALSTIAYQSAQGVPMDVLFKMHRNKGILIPDITFFIDVSSEIAEARLKKRGGQIEKFEKSNFRAVLIEQYRKLIKQGQQNERLFGKVLSIDGTRSITEVSKDVREVFDKFYNAWRKK